MLLIRFVRIAEKQRVPHCVSGGRSESAGSSLSLPFPVLRRGILARAVLAREKLRLLRSPRRVRNRL
jgi:hypothetical protein